MEFKSKEFLSFFGVISIIDLSIKRGKKEVNFYFLHIPLS